jgi:hypothetical protein
VVEEVGWSGRIISVNTYVIPNIILNADVLLTHVKNKRISIKYLPVINLLANFGDFSPGDVPIYT